MIDVPHLPARFLPLEERTAGFLLQANLMLLANTVDAFKSALEIFTYANKEIASAGFTTAACNSGWRFVAARDGAMSLYHFGRSAEATKTLLKSCPTVIAEVDPIKLKLAVEPFNRSFPRWVKLRDGVAHAGEILKSVEEARTNILKEAYEDTGMSISPGGWSLGNLSGEKYTVGWKGKMFSYPINSESLGILIDVAESICDVFRQFGQAGRAQERGLHFPTYPVPK